MKHFYIKYFFLFLSLFAIHNAVKAQTFTVSGTVTDSTGLHPIFGASVILKIPRDSTAPIVAGGLTDSLGNYTLTGVPNGFYRLRVNYTGYKPSTKRVLVKDSNVVVENVTMHYNGILLAGVDINEKQIRMTQNGDTTAFNAGAYKTNPDATAEDLVNKLPGVTNEGGTVKVNGEEVKQVLVDGKPYFGDDPNAALKNVPADMVDKVQVYDKSSDQSQFTGFDDGQSKKTINLVTKKQNMNGQFGKVYAGYGTNERYNAGVTLNLFNNARRITFLGMSNNINQQNFSMSDIMGSMGSSGGSGKPTGMMGMGGLGRSGGGGYSRGGGGSSNFSVSNLGGLTTTHSFGTNYNDEWGKKIKVSGSYFFNMSQNANNTTLSRNYFTTSDSVLAYTETNNASTDNINHRFNFKFEYAIDSMNTLILSTKFTSQYTDYSKTLDGINSSQSNTPQSTIYTENRSKNLGFNLTNGITFRHKLSKPGRTIGIDLSEGFNPRTGSGAYYSLNKYPNDTTLIDQHSNTKTGGYSLSAALAYSEPVGKHGQFLFNYAPSLTKNNTNKETNNFDFNSNDFTLMDSVLTNKYENTYLTQKLGINFRYNADKASIILGNDFQYATLTGNQTFPVSSTVNKHFQNILPNMTFNYKFSQGKNLKIIYRTATVAPTISQLQNILDNSNPLQLKSGNPELSQDFEHTLIAHYGKTNSEKATGFFAFFYAGLTSKYIGNSTFIATHDTTISGVFLNTGSQLIRYENMSGYKSGRGFLTYSFVLTKLKCNLSLNVSGGITETPSRINGSSNLSDNLNYGPGATLSSNISEKVDFTLSYNGSFTTVTNTIQKQSNTNYFSHTASFKFNWLPYKGLVLNTSLDQTYYSGLGEGFNTNYYLWNASIAYKFLKNKSLETKFSVFDILKQNTSVSRTVSDTYIEDSRTNTLGQYFMFTLTYNIKKFKGPAPTGGQGGNHTPPTQK